MKQPIYADNASTTRPDPAVIEAMIPWLREEYGNASQPYAFSRGPKRALVEARAVIAECLGARPEEIFFTSGGTEGDNWVIKGTALSSSKEKTILTSAFEHAAVMRSCSALQRLGYPVAYLTPTPDGCITPEVLRASMSRGGASLVSVMFANNEIGSIQPIGELCEIAHCFGALFHTDAVQAVGHIKIDINALGVDFLCASAHKFNGPKGIGFLYIRHPESFPPYVDGGAQERGLRAGTENVASIVGMAAALKLNCDRLEENRQHLRHLESVLLAHLNAAHLAYRLNGGENRLPGLMSLSFPGRDGEAILHRMDLMGICISTGSACNSVHTEISHVLRAIGLDEQYAKGTIRVSLGKNNTEEDAQRIAASLVKIVQG